MLVGSGVGSSVSMVRVNVCVHGHRVFDVDCGSCRRLNPDPTRRPRGLRRRHLEAVAVRDGYRCRLCGDPVDTTLPLEHGRAATSDHVIARAQGGSDHQDNLQLANRLARMNVELVEAALCAHGRRLVVVDDEEVDSDLVRDMVEVLTSFCARLYGRGSARDRAEKALVCAARDPS
jgi:hypothetical protein